MFRCSNCRNPSASGDKQHKRVTVTRDVVYNRSGRFGVERVPGKETIVEQGLCQVCADAFDHGIPLAVIARQRRFGTGDRPHITGFHDYSHKTIVMAERPDPALLESLRDVYDGPAVAHGKLAFQPIRATRAVPAPQPTKRERREAKRIHRKIER